MDRKKKTYVFLLGLYAADIRNYWGDHVGRRINRMFEFMRILGVDYPIDIEACVDDGRWMRDHWKGPYGGCHLNPKEILDTYDMSVIDDNYDMLAFPDDELAKAVKTYRNK